MSIPRGRPVALPGLAAVMTTPALPGASLISGAHPVTGRGSVPPPRSELAGRRPWAVEQGAASDAAWAVFRELRPQFDGLLPPGVVLDCVDHAVRDLLGSICVEALPEMAIRLAAVRLEHHLRRTDGPPGEPPTSCQPPGAAHQPSGASRNAGPAPASAFVVIRPPVPGYRPVALTVAATRAVSWDDAT